MIKLDSYDYINGSNGDFRVIKFIDNGGYKIAFTVRENGEIDLEVECSSLDDVKKAIEMIESGKVVIEL